MSKNPTALIAEQLIKQTEAESPQSLMWMISAMNRFLLLNPSMSLLEFKRIVGQSAPDTYNTFTSIRNSKGLKTID